MDPSETDADHGFLQQELHSATRNCADPPPFIIYTWDGCDAVGTWSQAHCADNPTAVARCRPCARGSFGQREESRQTKALVHAGRCVVREDAEK